jgi:YebC/PmpR family DNA-binding regulatory protein
MAGHSHWAGIKHKKALVDNRRGKLWSKLSKAIIIAAKAGGGDPAMNLRLRYAINDAKAVSMPKDNIERAIKRGTGDLEGVIYESITYEGYAPGGIAVLVDVLTDNRNRTGAEVRSIFTKFGGSMAEPGAVAWQFERKGTVLADRSADEDELMLLALDAGAEDLADDGEAWRITTPPTELHAVRTALEQGGVTVDSSELTMLPTATIQLDTGDTAKKVLRLVDALEDNDDVQDVHANFDIPDAILEAEV